MEYREYDEPRFAVRRFSPAGPAVVWGALMAVAVVAAGATALTAPNAAAERIVARNDDAELQRSLRQLTAERDALADRVARLERGVGELQVAVAPQADAARDVTGSINRPAAPAADAKPYAFGISFGPDATIDAVRRRWTALSARYPQILARLTPRSARRNGVFDLVAGPFATRSDADKACVALADQGFACDTTEFVGEPLPRS